MNAQPATSFKIFVITERRWGRRLGEGFTDGEEIAREEAANWEAAEKRAAEIEASLPPAEKDMNGISGFSVGFETQAEGEDPEWSHTFGDNLAALVSEEAAWNGMVADAICNQVHIESAGGWNNYRQLETALAEELVRRGDTTTQVFGRLADRDKPLGQHFAGAEWGSDDDGEFSDDMDRVFAHQTPCSERDAETQAVEILNVLSAQ